MNARLSANIHGTDNTDIPRGHLSCLDCHGFNEHCGSSSWIMTYDTWIAKSTDPDTGNR